VEHVILFSGLFVGNFNQFDAFLLNIGWYLLLLLLLLLAVLTFKGIVDHVSNDFELAWKHWCMLH